MRVSSDLRFSVAAPGQSPVTGTVTGDGTRVRVVTDDPAGAWRAAVGTPATGPAAVRFAAAQLADAGLHVEIVGPHGELSRLGADAGSLLGRIVTGSPHVRFGSPRALAPLAAAEGRLLLRRHRLAVLAVTAALSYRAVTLVRSRR